MNKENFLIDTHCHLDFVDFKSDINQIIQRANDNNVKFLITISTKLSNYKEIYDLTSKYNNVYGSIGTHPNNAHIEPNITAKNIVDISRENKKIVAIGECGLDYYRGKGHSKIQESLFREHIEASNYLDMPFIIHNRSSDNDMEKILIDESKNKKLKGVLHCFSSTKRLAEVAIEIGLYISVTGIITFKNSINLKEIIKTIPKDRIFIETDAPFLAPTPYRGKRNEPAYIIEIAKELADIYGTTYDDIMNITTNNALRLFDRIKLN